MIRRLLLVLLLLLPVPAAAQTLAFQFLEGSWAVRLDGSIIMRFDLERDEDGWSGAWVKPTSFASDGMRFGNIKMPATTRQSDEGRAIGEWAEITFKDPRPGEEHDVFRFRLIGPDKAEMLYVGTGLPPFLLERVSKDSILGPFVEGRVYGAPDRAARPTTGTSPVLPGPTITASPVLPGPALTVPSPARPATSSPTPSTAPRTQPAPSAAKPVQGPTDKPATPAMTGR